MEKNKICNPKTEVAESVEFNDKDYISCLLSYLKDIEKNICVFLTEASNEHLYKEIKKMFDEISSLQRSAFELSFKKGWYELEKAETKKINQKYSMLNQEFSGLN